jgi:hypothetical protein
MTTKPLPIILLSAIILLLALAPVHAELVINKYSNTFAATTPYNEQLKLCSCETKVDKVVIENTGTFDADFHIRAQSPYAGIRIPQQDLTLRAGQFAETLVFIEDSCGIRGEFPYDVIVTNSFGRSATISRSIRIDTCQTVGFSVSPEGQQVGLCGPAQYDVTVENVGTFPDTFRLSFGEYNGQVALGDHVLELEPGERVSQPVNVTFDCTEHGTRDIVFSVQADMSKDRSETSRSVTIENGFGFDMQVPSDVTVCAQTTTRIPVTVRNLAPVEDGVSLSLRSDAAAQITSQLTIEGKGSEEAILTLTPSAPGEQTIDIIATSRFGGIRKERTITAIAQECFDLAVDVRSAPDAVTAPESVCCGPRTFLVNIRNNGERAQIVRLAVDGSSSFRLDETTVRLDPGQNVNVPLRATLPCTDERYDATIVVWPQGEPMRDTTAQVSVQSRTQQSCYQAQITADELRIRQDAQSIPVVIRATGVEGGEYTLSADSSIIRVEAQNVTLAPGQASTVQLIPVQDLRERPIGRYVVPLTITHSSTGTRYIEDLGIELLPPAFTARNLWVGGFSACMWLVVVLALIIVLLVIALIAAYAGWSVAKEGLSRVALNTIKATLIIMLGALLLVMLLFVQPPDAAARYERAAVSGGFVVEWYQGAVHTVDLAPFVQDPDQDTVTFRVTQPSDVRAELAGTVLTLTADDGFAGTNELVVEAIDGRGASTTATFSLHVIAERSLSLRQRIDVWCIYIVLIELVLVVLLALLLVLTIKERRDRPYANNVLVVVDRKGGRSAKSGASKRSAPMTRTPAGKTIATSAPARETKTAAARSSRAVVPQTVLREYKASGQTVNIAVAPQQAPPTIVTVPGRRPSEVVYVGAKGGQTVHAPECMMARRIPRGKRVAFGSKKEAVKAGLVPCRVCRPFEGGM